MSLLIVRGWWSKTQRVKRATCWLLWWWVSSGDWVENEGRSGLLEKGGDVKQKTRRYKAILDRHGFSHKDDIQLLAATTSCTLKKQTDVSWDSTEIKGDNFYIKHKLTYSDTASNSKVHGLLFNSWMIQCIFDDVSDDESADIEILSASSRNKKASDSPAGNTV